MKPLIPASIVAASLLMLGVASAQEPAPGAAPAAPSIAAAQAAADKASAEIAQSEQEEKSVQELDKGRATSRAGRNKQFSVTPGTATLNAPAAVGPPYRLQKLIGRESNASRPLVIRSANADPKEQTNLEEDLTVMSHIFEKSLDDLPGGRPRGGFKAAGIDVVFAPNAAPMRSLYLDGYGALFLLNVSFPLVPPPQKVEQREKPAVDSAWTEAQEELFGQPNDEKGDSTVFENYSEEKVNKLKDLLFDSLKNATNIRGLKPEDSVTVCVFGGSSSGRSKGKGNSKRAVMPKDGETVVVQDVLFENPARQTILTLRVKKSDVDAYAKGKVNLEEFQKRVRATAYISGTGSSPLVPTVTGFGYSFGDNRF
jgi:hypothetical protein